MKQKMDDDKSGINIEQDGDGQFPLVLQCSECNLIIGDSKSWVSANSSLKSITLKCVTDKVQIENKISVSSTGSDAGSTYKLLKCTGCESRLGVQYLATPPEFDQFRNCFTLDVKKITSYQVGSEGQTSGNSSDLLRVISMDDVCKEIRKVQILMVEFGERILALEQKQNISYHGDSQSYVDITDNEQVLSTSKDHSSQQKRKLSSGPGGPTKKSKSK